MELLTPEQVPRNPNETVFRQSALQHVIALLVVLGLLAGLLVWSALGEVPLFVRILSVGGLTLIALVIAGMLGKSLSSRNWLMIASREHILVRFRSYLNTELPAEDPQIFSLRLENIRTVRRIREKIVSPGLGNRSGKRVSYVTSLELKVEGAVDLEPLHERLQYEKRAKAKKKYEDYPVRVTEQGTIRVIWNSPSARIRPGIDAAVRCLVSLGVREGEPVSEDRDLVLASADSREDVEAKILELVEEGSIIEAIKLTRETYGMSLKDAKEFVEGLSPGN